MYHLSSGKSFCGTHGNVHLKLWNSMTSSNGVWVAWKFMEVGVGMDLLHDRRTSLLLNFFVDGEA